WRSLWGSVLKDTRPRSAPHSTVHAGPSRRIFGGGGPAASGSRALRPGAGLRRGSEAGMRLLDGEWIFSASDLTGFAACEHLTQLERRAALGEIERPDRDDPLLEVLSARGGEHEERILRGHSAEVSEVVKIDCDTSTRGGLEAAAAQTLEAMRS